MAIERADAGCDGESGGDGCGAEFGGSAAWGEDAADCNVFDEVGVDPRAGDYGFEGADEEVGGLGVFEAAFAAFCEWGAEGAGYDDLERCLLADMFNVSIGLKK